MDKQLWYVHRVENYPTIKRRKLLIHTKHGNISKIIMQNKRRYKKYILYNSFYIRFLGNANIFVLPESKTMIFSGERKEWIAKAQGNFLE